jgi:division protein CdvB (Snf7/Vps24/ESCRT-III family)
LANKFIEKWKQKEKQPSIASKIKNVGKPTESLKDQINSVIQRLDAQTRTLDLAVKRFENRDAEIFGRIVNAIAQRDQARANILSLELSEIRKVEKMLTHASLALQSVSMRLNTVSEVGDLVTVLSPASNVLNTIRSEMCTVLPEASQELGNIGSLLSDIVSTTSQGTEITVNAGCTSPETEKILQEAELAVEVRLKEQLPEVAAGKHFEERASIET